MNKEIIKTNNAPEAIGPYSQATKLGNLIFTSGQLAIVPSTGKIIEGDVQAQTKQSIENVKAILESQGSSLDHVMKSTVFIKDMNDFPKMNEIYGQYFKENQPARSCVEVARLPKDGLIEIEVIAYIE